jgi:hypothetical protein
MFTQIIIQVFVLKISTNQKKYLKFYYLIQPIKKIAFSDWQKFSKQKPGLLFDVNIN